MVLICRGNNWSNRFTFTDVHQIYQTTWFSTAYTVCRAKLCICLNQRGNMAPSFTEKCWDPRDSLRCAITALIQLTDASLRSDISWAVFHHGNIKDKNNSFSPLFLCLPLSSLHLARLISPSCVVRPSCSDHYCLPSENRGLIGRDVDGGESERRSGPTSMLIGYGCE